MQVQDAESLFLSYKTGELPNHWLGPINISDFQYEFSLKTQGELFLGPS